MLATHRILTDVSGNTMEKSKEVLGALIFIAHIDCTALLGNLELLAGQCALNTSGSIIQKG